MEHDGWLLQSLEEQRQSFVNTVNLIPSHHYERFRPWCDLLEENDESLQKRSRSRRSVRVRARKLLMHIYVELGPDVFYLCTLTSNITKLATVELTPTLRQWWNSVQHPQILSTIARNVCDYYSVEGLVPPGLTAESLPLPQPESLPSRQMLFHHGNAD